MTISHDFRRLRRFPRLALWMGVLAVLGLTLTSLPAGAQDFRLQNLGGGGPLTDADLAQGSTLVVVWASWSPRCRDIDQRVRQLADRYGNRARVVAVNFQEDRQTASAFLADHPMNVPVYLDQDGTFSKKHAITTLPGLLVMQNGVASYRGKLPDDPAQALADLFP